MKICHLFICYLLFKRTSGASPFPTYQQMQIEFHVRADHWPPPTGHFFYPSASVADFALAIRSSSTRSFSKPFKFISNVVVVKPSDLINDSTSGSSYNAREIITSAPVDNPSRRAARFTVVPK